MLSSAQLDHIQVVERHEMSVSTEDIHVALGIDETDVSVTCCRLGPSDEAEFVFVSSSCIITAKLLSSLLHLLVVLVEALVGVLDEECVHHCNGCGRAEALTLRTSSGSFCNWLLNCASLHGGSERWAASHACSSTGGASTFLSTCRRGAVAVALLLHGLTALWATIHEVWTLLSLAELHSGVVKDEHVIELLSQF